MTRVEIHWLYHTVLVKDQVLGRSSEGLFRTPDRISHRIHIVGTSCNQLVIWDFLPACWGCLLTPFTEICVPNDKLDFSGDNYQIKLPAKFCLHSFEWFCLQISSNTKYFSFLHFISDPKNCGAKEKFWKSLDYKKMFCLQACLCHQLLICLGGAFLFVCLFLFVFIYFLFVCFVFFTFFASLFFFPNYKKTSKKIRLMQFTTRTD